MRPTNGDFILERKTGDVVKVVEVSRTTTWNLPKVRVAPADTPGCPAGPWRPVREFRPGPAEVIVPYEVMMT